MVTAAASEASAWRAADARTDQASKFTATSEDVGRTAASVARSSALQSGATRAEAEVIANHARDRAITRLAIDGGDARVRDRLEPVDKSVLSRSEVRNALLLELRQNA